ncbi:MAG TPA: HEAT repeat domain-containing protein [Acidimicrobiia bacterium]
MHSPDELLAGLLDPDWMVRIEVIDRLIARGRDDPRTVPALITAAESDASPDIRSTILMRLHRFQSNRVIDLLRSAPITDRAAFPVHNVTIPRAAS